LKVSLRMSKTTEIDVAIIGTAPPLMELSRLLSEEGFTVLRLETISEAIERFSEPGFPPVVAFPPEYMELADAVGERSPQTQRVIIAGPEGPEPLKAFFDQGRFETILTHPWSQKGIQYIFETTLAEHRVLKNRDDLAALQDASNLKLQALTESSERLFRIRARQIEQVKREIEGTLDAILDPVQLVDTDFSVIRANLAVARLSGLHIRTIPGRKCHQTLFCRNEPCELCPVLSATEDGDLKSGLELEHPTSGRIFRLSVFRAGRQTEETLFACYYRDITEEKTLQRQVTQSEKMAAVGQLAGGVAHEINNPLGVIISFGQLAQSRAQIIRDEELVDDMDEILKAAERCRKIVRGLLDFSRPARDEEIGPVDMTKILTDSVFLVQTQYKTKRISVETDYHEDTPMAEGNANKFQQVTINLVQNAFQAMEDKGTLSLSTRRSEDGLVEVVVRDSGCGIEQKDLVQIFEPFFSTKRVGEGTGLGLSIAYGIIQDSEGSITVDSEIGAGTTFTLKLPRSRTAEII
jgi:two-component system, NtrC family, sensor kinase